MLAATVVLPLALPPLIPMKNGSFSTPPSRENQGGLPEMSKFCVKDQFGANIWVIEQFWGEMSSFWVKQAIFG